MKHLLNTLQAFYCDEEAAEVTELAIVLALIVAGAVAFIAAIGPKIADYYQETDEQL